MKTNYRQVLITILGVHVVAYLSEELLDLSTDGPKRWSMWKNKSHKITNKKVCASPVSHWCLIHRTLSLF